MTNVLTVRSCCSLGMVNIRKGGDLIKEDGGEEGWDNSMMLEYSMRYNGILDVNIEHN